MSDITHAGYFSGRKEMTIKNIGGSNWQQKDKTGRIWNNLAD
ncbi:MAG: hypothetical protein ACYDCN_00400 [Bacteroidia bacterium]